MIEQEIEEIKRTICQHGYEYKKFLGKGSYSSVVLCESKKYEKEFAVKRAIKQEIYIYEFSTLISLSHPNIISLYDSFEDENFSYFIMDYCSNGTFRQKVKLSYENFINYSKQMLEALAYCHSNKVAHRDIKPDNIFLDQYDQVKLGDFGLSKQFNSNLKSTEKCGSMAFKAPEMFLCQEICPFKADIWALGITFFFMATGECPFKSISREKLKQSIIFGDLDYGEHKVDSRIKFLISKMTQKNPESRPTAEKLLELPMFNPNLSKKTLLLNPNARRNSYCKKFYNHSLIFYKSTNVIHHRHREKSDDESKPISLLDAHCFKSIIISPKTQ